MVEKQSLDKYRVFLEELAQGIVKGLDHNGESYKFNVEKAIQGVVDVLEKRGMIMFYEEN